MIAVAVFLYSAPRLATGLGLRLLTGQGGLNTNVELDEARNRLMSAVGQEEFLAQARTLINTARQDKFSHAYSVANISGLSEIYDTTYQVPTDIAAELSRLLERLDGHMHEINREFRQQMDLDLGPVLPFDEAFGGYDPSAHVIDDFFKSGDISDLPGFFPLVDCGEVFSTGKRLVIQVFEDLAGDGAGLHQVR